MKCPVCGNENLNTLSTRNENDSVIRRKFCPKCQNRWTTIEIDSEQWYSALQIKAIRKRKEEQHEPDV